MPNSWEDWCVRLDRLAQDGLAETTNPYDRDRYETVKSLVSSLRAGGCALSGEPPRPHRLLPWPVTPKVDVRGVVYRDDALLFVRERSDGGWTFPGGWADVGVSPARNVEREIWEEAGFETRAVRLLAVLDRQRHAHPPHEYHIYKLFLQCEILGGHAATSVETNGVAFFREDQIPNLSVGRVTRQQVLRMFELCRQPDVPPDFD